MSRWSTLFPVVALLVLLAAATGRPQSTPAAKPNFSGVWTLNRDLSDQPSHAADGGRRAAPQGDDRSGRGDGRGTVDPSTPPGRFGRQDGRAYRRYGTPGAGEQRAAIDQLTTDLSTPSPSLTISHGTTALIVTDAKERTRVFQTTGQRDPHQVGTATILSVTRWDGDRLITDYDLGTGRRIRIVYSLAPGGRQLTEQITFATGETTRRVYDSTRPARRP